MKTLFAFGVAAALLAGCASDYGPTASYAGQAAAPAADTAGGGSGCFRTQDIRSHRIADAQTLYLDVTGRGVYRLDMSGRCMGGASRQETLITEAPPSGMICSPVDLSLKVRVGSTAPATACIISSMTRLTPAEVEALPRELRP